MQRVHRFRPLILSFALLALTACGERPGNASYLNRGGPESLLDVSSEVVNLSAGTQKDLRDLSDWIGKDQPTRAELNCNGNDRPCKEARKLLDLHGVPVVQGAGSDLSVTLVYERILARDCNSSYVDNRDNFYNRNHPSFGCAVAANMVQHVTDKQEFINPALSDDPSAVRAVNDMRRAYTPRDIVKPYTIDESLVGAAQTGSQ